jgi:hypothetical protein
MGTLVRHEPCPKCRAFGADRKGNNLARYSDGSAWCYAGHGLLERADKIPVIDEKWQQKEENGPVLDLDLDFNYPSHVVTWLDKYGISVQEAIGHGWKYGPFRDQLVFIFKDQYGNISCTQARNFSPTAKRKYFNQGDANSTLPIFQCPSHGTAIVVVEDAVSAAKIGRQRDSIPCLGSYFPKAKLNALRLLGYEELSVWLDSDKLREAMKIADQARWLGFSTQVVHTPLDPKEYSDGEIAHLLSIERNAGGDG